MHFDQMLVFAQIKMAMRPKDFWQLTFGEWWPLFNAYVGNTIKPLDHSEMESLEERWINGNT